MLQKLTYSLHGVMSTDTQLKQQKGNSCTSSSGGNIGLIEDLNKRK